MRSLTPLLYGAPTDKCGITVRFGIAEGFFREEGIDLITRVIYGGPELAAAYTSGEIPFGEMGSPPCVVAIANGAQFTIVGGGVRRKAHMYIGMRKDIDGWNGLIGKRIGLLSRGSCPDWFLRTMLKKRGFDPDRDVEIISLYQDYARVVDVIEEGRIDAALAVEPAISIGEDRGVLKALQSVYEDDAVPPVQWIVRVANNDFADRNRSLVEAALRASVRSSLYAEQHIDEWAEFAADHYGIPLKTAAKAIMRDLPALHFSGELDLNGLQNVLDLQLQLAAISRPVKLDEVINRRFVM